MKSPKYNIESSDSKLKRRLVISDIHGCYEQFIQLLELVKYSPRRDQLILLGDYVDRGRNSKEVVELVIKLVKEDGAIALQGNHDERFVDVVLEKNTETADKFFQHGGQETLMSYTPLVDNLQKFKDIVKDQNYHHLVFLESLPYYFEDDDYIYVHAGLNPEYQNWKDQPKKDFLYIKDPFIYRKLSESKTVIFGHTKTKDIHGSADIWFGEGKIGIDGGCAYGLQLNCLEIKGNNELKTYQIKASS